MCDTCGCNITDGNRHLIEEGGKLAKTESGQEAVTVLKGLLSENDRTAAHNREHFDRHHVLALNLMSSPGSGKTRLLEETIAGRQVRLKRMLRETHFRPRWSNGAPVGVKGVERQYRLLD